jgi:hypothetical protein
VVRKTDLLLNGMKMDRRNKKENTRMVQKMDFGLAGTKTETSPKPKRTGMVC